jgi:hypothetical protein
MTSFNELRKIQSVFEKFYVYNIAILFCIFVRMLLSLLRYSRKLEMLALSNSSLASAFLDWFHRAQNIFDSADSWFETSGHNGVEYKECEGKQNWAWKSGYSTVLDLLTVSYSPGL